VTVAPVVHIGGWPGAGKRTVGRIVADMLDGRLIHNHLMLDAARAIYARETQESIAMREEVRALILFHAQSLPDEVPVILTDALADEPAAIPLFQPALDLARNRNDPLSTFVLDLALEENQRRLTDPSRRGGDKLMDADVLRTIRASNRLFLPKGSVTLDVTEMSATDAAVLICAHVGQLHG